MGEIHELFVLALSLVWFAGATPDSLDLKSVAVACQSVSDIASASQLLPFFQSCATYEDPILTPTPNPRFP